MLQNLIKETVVVVRRETVVVVKKRVMRRRMKKRVMRRRIKKRVMRRRMKKRVMRRRMKKRVIRMRMMERMKRIRLLRMKNMKKKKRCMKKKNWDAAKNWEFGLCEESDEQLSMLQCLRYKIATKIMLHQFNDVSNKMFDFAFTFKTKNTEQARVSMIVDAIKNMNNRDPPKQVKETDAANVVVGVHEAVYQVKEKGCRKK
ncbi:hypothetical protein Tco_0776937 [Tanacetum coccineum]